VVVRAQDQERAAKCPVCGKYMDKKETIVAITTNTPDDSMQVNYITEIGWFCKECNEKGSA